MVAIASLSSITATNVYAMNMEEMKHYYSASAFYTRCSQTMLELEGRAADSTKSAECLAWIDGFRFGFEFGVLLPRQEIFGCPEHPINNGDFVRIFVYGMQKRPNLFAGDISDAIKEIFTAEFPC